jgi:hypothetical protein
MVYTLLFFSSKCSLFHNSKIFGSCIIHILYTGHAKIKKIIPLPPPPTENSKSNLRNVFFFLCFLVIPWMVIQLKQNSYHFNFAYWTASNVLLFMTCQTLNMEAAPSSETPVTIYQSNGVRSLKTLVVKIE